MIHHNERKHYYPCMKSFMKKTEYSTFLKQEKGQKETDPEGNITNIGPLPIKSISILSCYQASVRN